MNQIIGDLKIKPLNASKEEIRSKDAAISAVAEAFRNALATGAECLNPKAATWVPIPPSAIRGDVLYDDRVLKLLSTIEQGLGLDIRELVKQYKNVQPAHESELRPSVSEIAENYYIDDGLISPCPTGVWIFDDVLTGGNHYKAMQSVIQRRFPGVVTVGMFVARRVPEEAAQISWREKMKTRAAVRPSLNQPD
jgi:hypothetical protein